MNKKAQIKRMLSLVSPMALRAIELPPEARDRFIENEVAGLRKTFEYEYRDDPKARDYALEFTEMVDEWIKAMVKILEHSGDSVRRG